MIAVKEDRLVVFRSIRAIRVILCSLFFVLSALFLVLCSFFVVRSLISDL